MWDRRNKILDLILVSVAFAFVSCEKTTHPDKSDTTSILIRANFSGQALSGRSFAGVYARWARFRQATLANADFSNAFLYGADFRGAQLEGAHFRGADLRFADFRDSDLRGADFSGAVLLDARMEGARLDSSTRLPGKEGSGP